MNIQDIFHLMMLFHEPGSLPEGGVTRLGYSKDEDRMHAIFRRWGEENDFYYESDAVGNSYLANAAARQSTEWILIGSHLDSVIQGGRFDGVAGVVSGMAVLKWLEKDGISLPVKVAAFRCEESAAFNRSTLGSGLVTHLIRGEAVADFSGRDGKTVREVFAERAYTLYPPMIKGIREYLELHIEQGKVLETLGKDIGIVEAIAAPRRFRVRINGTADHSGATPMNMRHDALCAAAELVLAVEALGKTEAVVKSVATVGVLQISPGAMNVIPGSAEMKVDTRGIDMHSIDRMEQRLRSEAARIAHERGIIIQVEKRSEDRPVLMDPGIREKLKKSALQLGFRVHEMPSGAGHDALSFADLFPTGMIFIPCKDGISHNPAEYASKEAIYNGARVLYRYLTEK